MTPEGRVKAMVRRVLDPWRDRVYWFMPVQGGIGTATLDYLLCANGRFLAIETKAPGKKLTPRQALTAHAIAEAGGMVFVIRDEADAVRMISQLNHTQSLGGAVFDPLGSFENYGRYWCR